MRYEKFETLLQLALEMQARRQGVSLEDIRRMFGVSQRTAQRMRDALQRVFPQLEETIGEDRRKRWHLPRGMLDALLSLTPDEFADLEAAIHMFEAENLGGQAETLRGLVHKLRAATRPEVLLKVGPDLEALTEAEGIAARPGPRPRIRWSAVDALREAIKGCQEVELDYESRGSGIRKRQRVNPYGFLYGHRHYLIGWSLSHQPPGYRLYSLSNIHDVELKSQMFTRDPTFSLAGFARRSFGVFQEEPVDVAWRFSPEAAAVAREFQFHPEQTLEECADGSLIVRFRAGGQLEMAWHLYRWGDRVEVLGPESLRAMVAACRPHWPALP